jgi:hypothetical protein
MFDLPSTNGVQLTAAVSVVQVKGQPEESVWLSVRAVGLPDGIRFDLEDQSCAGEAGDSLDRGGAADGNAMLYRTQKLVLPPAGHPYNVVLRRYRGDPIGGITIYPNKVFTPITQGSRGC